MSPWRLGLEMPRVDAVRHLTGRTQYGADVPPVQGMLHARLVLSPYARGRIIGIRREAALSVAGVVAVLTADDLPIVGQEPMRMFEPLARDEVVFAGQPVAVVLGETPEAASDGADLVEVSIEPQEPVVSFAEAREVDAPVVRTRAAGRRQAQMAAHAAVDTTSGSGRRAPSRSNVFQVATYQSGDVERELARCDVVVSGLFRTPRVYQAALEPQVATAIVHPDGVLTVITATQGVGYTRSQLLKIFALDGERLRVVGSPLGGSFGAKTMLVEPIAVGAALRLRRSVRLELTRAEDFRAGNPMGAFLIEVRVGAYQGRLAVLEASVCQDVGAFAEWASPGVAAFCLGGPYRWEAWNVEALAVETNFAGVGPYRAPGGPAAAFAVESLIDELATRLQVDPIDLRRASLARPGDPQLDGRPWPPTGAELCLERLRSHELWTNRNSLPANEGIGLALGVWPGGKAAAAAVCRLDPDGVVSVATGIADMSGASTGLVALAADAFGVEPGGVRLVQLDSNAAPASPYSGGSTLTYSVGPAIIRAAAALRQRVLEIAGSELEIAPDDLEIVGRSVRVRGTPGASISLARISELAADGGRYLPVEAHATNLPPDIAPLAAACLAHVRVDPETGEATIRRLVMAQDVGRAINRALVRGQMVGAAVQGIGWALKEELCFDGTGNLLSGSFLDYGVCRAEEVPTIDAEIVELPAPHGPHGARGVGEGSVVPTPAAIVNAIAAATGVRPRELPVTSARLWRALADRS